MSVTVNSTHQEYTALTQGAAFQVRPEGGVLELGDADRVDFLHRMTTNDIATLQSGQSTITILTSPTARIVLVFSVLIDEEKLILMPALGETAALGQHLRSQIFFMDKVTVSDRSAEFCRLRVMGPDAADVIGKMGLELAAAADGEWQDVDGLVAVKQIGYDLPGYELIVPDERLSAVITDLTNAGALPLDDETAYQARRVELGRPLVGSELTDAYNPLEAGMRWACADDKGCYTGQEIIARQVTYDKVTKTLVGLQGENAFAAGSDVTVDGRTAGKVTSTAQHPLTGAHLALAILKRPRNEAGTQVEVDGISATVVALPFPAPPESL